MQKHETQAHDAGETARDNLEAKSRSLEIHRYGIWTVAQNRTFYKQKGGTGRAVAKSFLQRNS
jgi:hypothetical protein